MALDTLQDVRRLRGLDALDAGLDAPRRRSAGRAGAAGAWPKLAAVAIVLGIWQAVVLWSGWKPSYVLPGPAPVFAELGRPGQHRPSFWHAVGVTLTRGVVGFLVADRHRARAGRRGGAVDASCATAIGSMITGLQTMPSIAWFPLAILLFQLTEQAILFVILIGAVPSIANGVIGGVDYVPPLLVRAGRNLGRPRARRSTGTWSSRRRCRASSRG